MSLSYILVKVDTDMDSYYLASILRWLAFFAASAVAVVVGSIAILRRRARLKRGLDPALFGRLRKLEAETKRMMDKRGG